MLDVHSPHATVHTWKDIFVHIATITVGLLIAVGLEQSVEALHHRHQRQQLDEDLSVEAERNRKIILRNLGIQDQETWFQSAAAVASSTAAVNNRVSFTLPTPPCYSGSVGTPEMRYFAPSEAVWATAKESGLVSLLPAEQARIYSRLVACNN